MSSEETSAETNDDDQTNQVSDLFQQDADGAQLVRLYDTRLQNLPNELLEDILIRAVVMEVKSLKLAKCVWKEKADLVISRLGTVCLQWNSLLTTNIFRKKVHGILEGTAQETVRLETLHQSRMHLFVFRVVALRDEMFVLWRPGYKESFINVHERNNTVDVKDVIPLPGILPVDMSGCCVSNCVYVLNKEAHCLSVLRITKDEEQKFHLSPWVNDPIMSFPVPMPSFPRIRLFLSVNGNLIILSRQVRPTPSVVSIYSADGPLEHEVKLFPDVHGFIRHVFGVIQKSNGNLVFATAGDRPAMDLKEIDLSGNIIRTYCSSMFGGVASVADTHGRIFISYLGIKDDLLDSEFNLMSFTDPRHHGHLFLPPGGIHYNSGRNEILLLCESAGWRRPAKRLTIFRFKED